MDYWANIQNFYHQGLYCDLELYAAGSNVGLKCHKLILASVSKNLNPCLRLHSRFAEETNMAVVVPETSEFELRALLDCIYDKLNESGFKEDFLRVSPGLTETLGLAYPKLEEMKTFNVEQFQVETDV